ncbi:FAS1 domain-containing protein [Xylogone sp. PMI_703]|nr:FAS1 domain-containing protein [Xylogone sp. PMI_703]
MKALALLHLAAAATALVLPEGEILSQIIESQEPASTEFHILPEDSGYPDILSVLRESAVFSEKVFDGAIQNAEEKMEHITPSFQCSHSMSAFHAEEWFDSTLAADFYLDPINLKFPDDKRPRRPHHGHHGHHHKPNKTIYELISSSNHTTKLAKLIDEYPDLVKTLNGTAANYTLFAPTDKAFERIPHHGDHKPSKEVIEKILSYHISKDFYPLGRFLISHTIPTTLELDSLGGAQRLRAGLGFRGLNVNFYSKILLGNIFATNGVIHAVDHILLPPPSALKIISLLPTEFSTLTLGLEKTGLLETLSTAPHVGGTFFAPNNAAFKKLGPRINAFLFSKFGEKYLKALLKYHVSVNQTLYSDAFYKAKEEAEFSINDQTELDTENFPKGHFHVDLPTLLGGKPLSVDIGRFGGFIRIRINGFTAVAVQDGLASDGVIQVVRSILLPPHPRRGSDETSDSDTEEELTVEDLIERLEPYIDRVLPDEL